MRLTAGLGLLVALSVCACGDDPELFPDARCCGPPVDAGGNDFFGPFAWYFPIDPATGGDWGEVPFPNDLHIHPSGGFSMNSLPAGDAVSSVSAFHMYEALANLNGAAPTTNVYFPMEVPVDESTLDGRVKLVDLDDPDLTEIPIDVEVRNDHTTYWGYERPLVVVSLRPGTTLRPGGRYAAYMTLGVKSVDGWVFDGTGRFLTAIDLSATPLATELRIAQDSLRPLIEALPPSVADTLISATVFRVEDPTIDLAGMRDVVAAAPPASTVTQVLSSAAELEGIFGVQDPSAPPGLSIGAIRPQPHGHVAAAIHGTIELANFLAATPQTAGFLSHDVDGNPIVKGVESVRFTLTLPAANGGSYADTPVMIFAHDLGRARSDMLAVADSAAAHGIATFAIDFSHHGDRAIDAVDAIGNVSGSPGADGFGDLGTMDDALRFLHVAGDSGGVGAGHPRAIRENIRQAAIDVCSAVSFLRGGDLTPIRAAMTDAGLPGDFSVHAAGVAYASESFGSIVGVLAVAVEPGIGIATLSVGGGGLPHPAINDSPVYTDTFRAFAYAAFDVAGRNVLGADDERNYRWEPMTTIWSYALAEADPMSYAPLVLGGDLRGGIGPSLLVTQAWSDETMPNEATESLARSLGLPRMITALPTPPPPPALRHVTLPEVAAPLAGNIGPGQTAAHTLWHPATNAMMVFLDDVSIYEPGFPPFMSRPEALAIDNPIAPLHAMWGRFFADWFEGRTPELHDPFAP